MVVFVPLSTSNEYFLSDDPLPVPYQEGSEGRMDKITERLQ
jgi:hypothetical protein